MIRFPLSALKPNGRSRTLHLGITALLVSVCESGAFAAEAPTGFLDKTITDESGEHKYVVFVPANYDPAKRWPIMMFLHGSGERGTDNRRQINIGLGPAIRKDPARCPAIVVFPQAESKEIIPIDVWSPVAPDGERALRILAREEKEYSIDPDRVYLTGVSMGGFGTWANAIADPERWAALVPVCGGGKTDQIKRIVHLPVWCFHGAADVVVLCGFSRMMVDALKKAGGEPKYTEYPGVGHDSWNRAYEEPELWTWLFAQKRQPR